MSQCRMRRGALTPASYYRRTAASRATPYPPTTAYSTSVTAPPHRVSGGLTKSWLVALSVSVTCSV